MALNTKYSYKSFKRQDLTKIDPAEFNNSEIIGSCFYQDIPYSDFISSSIVGVTFTRCNLDNCNIPSGATVNGGTNKHFRKQNDGEFWIEDAGGKIKEPRDKQKFTDCGLSTDPKDIPLLPLSEPITYTNDPKIKEEKEIEKKMYDKAWIKQKLIDDGVL